MDRVSILLFLQVLAGKTRVMCLGDGSLLPLLIAKSEIQSIQKVCKYVGLDFSI